MNWPFMAVHFMDIVYGWNSCTHKNAQHSFIDCFYFTTTLSGSISCIKISCITRELITTLTQLTGRSVLLIVIVWNLKSPAFQVCLHPLGQTLKYHRWCAPLLNEIANLLSQIFVTHGIPYKVVEMLRLETFTLEWSKFRNVGDQKLAHWE